MENAACYAPQILVSTEDLPREQWLEYRRKGIGGSDAAAVLGISPFRTGRDLYYDKLNIVTADDAENWVQLEVGTLLEPLVAKIFAHKTGYKIYRRPFMFQHPLYPWMLADLDYMVELPDGTSAILEIKTTNYNAKDNWWYNGEEIVPIYYESQGRHYMAVMNIDRVYFCCLYGNSEDEAMIRRIDRDMAYEEELIALERDFWENHVLTKTPPPYVEADGDLILESLRRKLGPADKDAPPVLLGQTQFGQLSMLLSLQEQKKALSADVSKLDKDIKRLKGIQQYLTTDPDGINWIKIGDTDKGGKYIYKTKEKIRPEGVTKSRMVHSGDFLLTNSMSFGRPYILKTDGCIHDGWLVLSNRFDCYSVDFLYYILSSPFAYYQFCDSVSGAVVKNLNSDKVSNALFPLPPLNEQRRIVQRIEELFPLVKGL